MYDLDPNVVATIMQLESCGYQYAGSSKGAMGLFQVMPFHFKTWQDPYDPETNAIVGLNYLKVGLKLFDDNLGLALAGYNMGHGSVFQGWWSYETDRYYLWTTGILEDIQNGFNPSPTLLDWYGNGRSTCNDAKAQLQLD